MVSNSALDQFLAPAAGWLTPQGAEKLVAWSVGEELGQKVQVLGQKANSGMLSDEEDAEYCAYLEEAEIISLMQAKARRLYFQSKE